MKAKNLRKENIFARDCVNCTGPGPRMAGPSVNFWDAARRLLLGLFVGGCIVIFSVLLRILSDGSGGLLGTILTYPAPLRFNEHYSRLVSGTFE